MSGLQDFGRRLNAARADFKPYAGKALEELGEKFLDTVQEAIRRAGNIDSEALLSSFEKGEEGNIWQLDLGGLTLTVGTDIKYAQLVNDGHRQQPGRFVPGYWEGKHFRYVKGAKTGMVLKAGFVKGSGFFDKSVSAMEKLSPVLLERSMDQFMRRYFG